MGGSRGYEGGNLGSLNNPPLKPGGSQGFEKRNPHPQTSPSLNRPLQKGWMKKDNPLFTDSEKKRIVHSHVIFLHLMHNRGEDSSLY